MENGERKDIGFCILNQLTMQELTIKKVYDFEIFYRDRN